MAQYSHSFSLFLILLLACIGCTTACYTAVFSFGDSLTDAGNLIHLEPDGSVPHMYFPPYGETFFGHPTGRCSDGRLIVDLIAEYYGLTIPPPSLSNKAETGGGGNKIGRQGINFAVVGSRALAAEFYEKLGIYDTVTNVSMNDQLNAFKDIIPSLCNSPSDCKNLLENSLFVLGEFGGNDYTHSLLSGKDITVIRPIIPIVAHAIAEGVHKLIELGARTVMVPSVLPLGCAASYLTYYPSHNVEDYDKLGCLIWVNKMAYYHNQLLQKELNLVRDRHPYANIIYTDIFSAAMQIYDGPTSLGFSGGALTACCGGGGPYNFNPDLQCGDEGATSCSDPSTYANWDGYHLTEAAYKLITKSLLDGPYTYPRMNTLCPANGKVAQA